MDKCYDPKNLEARWYKVWEDQQYFAPSDAGDSYCIMIPPPNVTGVLHMGHGFQNSIQDALIRYQRMSGKKVLWQVGTDHAGIATQMVVERQLQASNISKHDLGREAFLERVWQWKNTSGGLITGQMRRLGISVDWQRECFTMDAARSQAVTEAFVRLYREGLIYRGQRLVNWDPTLLTAVSDLEVIAEEEDGHLWHFHYPLSDGSAHITIATTRPETLLGDTAVAVHPTDPRYQHLLGKTVRLPLCDRDIPVIADDYVDPAFGSGCVKITPAHDFNDYAIGQRHQLPIITIFTPDAHTNDNVPRAFQGLSREAARIKVVEAMQAQGLVAKIEKHRLKIPRGDRSGVIIEPYLTDQWFVHAAPLAQPAIAAVATGKIKFMPENWQKTYFQWLENIEDWCISRQLWWGHRIPAWYDDHGNVYVGYDAADIRQHYRLSENIALRQDNDVLDTWFSSALWPFATLGWPQSNDTFNTFYPTSVLVTGFDIIFFWVARMVMFGLHFTGDVPFREVYITPLIRDAEGKKMSKSKGNALDPIDLIDGIGLSELIAKNTQHLMQPEMASRIEKSLRKQFPEGITAFGTDALRFTFCALASPGRNVNFDLERIAGYRNFCNKLWNAARYVLLNCESQDTGLAADSTIELSLADKWVISRLQTTIVKAHKHFAEYRFDLLCMTLYDFTWHVFCDWYLELAKPVLTQPHASLEAQRGTRQTLVRTLESILKLLHPCMPFITEEIWQRVAPLAGASGKTIMLAPYPQAHPHLIDQHVEQEMDWLQQVIVSVRTIRSQMDIAPGKALPLLMQHGSDTDQQRLQHYQPLLCQLAKLSSIVWLAQDAQAPEAATALVEELHLLIPMAGLIDKQAELQRLTREIDKLVVKHDKLQAKLANPHFSDKAPAEVVAKEHEQLISVASALSHLREQYSKVKTL
jgi:valyl-tRNA synthetase